MAESKPQIQTHYAYRPASSRASEAMILDEGFSNSPSQTQSANKHDADLSMSATQNSPEAFRPNLLKRTSFNYVQAEAAARSGQGPATSGNVDVASSDAETWPKPLSVRQQSWSEQEFKHQMQGRLMGGEKEAGFSETGETMPSRY